MQSRSLLPPVAAIAGLLIVAMIAVPGVRHELLPREQAADKPGWLKAHAGDGDGHIGSGVAKGARFYLESEARRGPRDLPPFGGRTRPDSRGCFSTRFASDICAGSSSRHAAVLE